MFYADDIREAAKQYSRPDITEQEMNMARTLINSMDTLEPSKYKDEYQVSLRNL